MGVKKSFNEEMMEHLEPYARELEGLIDRFMGSIEGAFMEGFEEIFSDMGDEGEEKKEGNG